MHKLLSEIYFIEIAEKEISGFATAPRLVVMDLSGSDSIPLVLL
jgi:hypothetical protein